MNLPNFLIREIGTKPSALQHWYHFNLARRRGGGGGGGGGQDEAQCYMGKKLSLNFLDGGESWANINSLSLVDFYIH